MILVRSRSRDIRPGAIVQRRVDRRAKETRRTGHRAVVRRGDIDLGWRSRVTLPEGPASTDPRWSVRGVGVGATVLDPRAAPVRHTL